MKGPFITVTVMKGPFLTLVVMKGPFVSSSVMKVPFLTLGVMKGPFLTLVAGPVGPRGVRDATRALCAWRAKRGLPAGADHW